MVRVTRSDGTTSALLVDVTVIRGPRRVANAVRDVLG
jgi:hypothetical protein